MNFAQRNFALDMLCKCVNCIPIDLLDKISMWMVLCHHGEWEDNLVIVSSEAGNGSSLSQTQ